MASSPDEINRIWGHGLHEERLFYDRLNYFTAMQVGLLGVFAILYNKDPRPGVMVPLTAAALAFTLLWSRVQVRHWRYCVHINDQIKREVPEYQRTLVGFARPGLAYNDAIRGKGPCCMGLDADLAQSHVTSQVISYPPDCPIGGGGNDGGGGAVVVNELQLAPTARVMQFYVSSPAGASAAHFCTVEQEAQGRCAQSGVKLERSTDGSGQGRECFAYKLNDGDIGKKGAVYVASGDALVKAQQRPLELGYLPCPQGGQPAP